MGPQRKDRKWTGPEAQRWTSVWLPTLGTFGALSSLVLVVTWQIFLSESREDKSKWFLYFYFMWGFSIFLSLCLESNGTSPAHQSQGTCEGGAVPDCFPLFNSALILLLVSIIHSCGCGHGTTKLVPQVKTFFSNLLMLQAQKYKYFQPCLCFLMSNLD